MAIVLILIIGVLTPFTSGAYSESKINFNWADGYGFNPLHFRGIL
ncbi:Uncharacterized protein dnl_41240 [Desulfonema limicola]|uniref:Uncharacterized protein n=1 Tax=Desulfonema limicola TaxID=45656 RepID=A0A975BAL2_9BACT|nr:Uncharacterized protein dnl_41240 [Desulfonema limicola]